MRLAAESCVVCRRLRTLQRALDVSFGRGVKNGRVPQCVPTVRISTGSQQGGHDTRLTVEARPPQRGFPVGVHPVSIRTLRQMGLYGFEIARPGSLDKHIGSDGFRNTEEQGSKNDGRGRSHLNPD